MADDEGGKVVRKVPMGLRDFLELLRKAGYNTVSIDGLLGLVYVDDDAVRFSEALEAPPEPLDSQRVFPMPSWASSQNRRVSGLVENVCAHGVAHPSKESVLLLESKGLRGFHIHECPCKCCEKK